MYSNLKKQVLQATQTWLGYETQARSWHRAVSSSFICGPAFRQLGLSARGMVHAKCFAMAHIMAEFEQGT